MERRTVSRTCASVRSSLSARAWRATAGSEAVETMYPCNSRTAAAVRKPLGLRASRGSGARLSGMSNESELPSGTVKISRATRCCSRLRPKMVTRSDAPPVHWEHTDTKTVGVLAGTNPRMSSMRNTVSPTSRLREKASVPARAAVGVAGKGCWRKRRPVCNGSDRRCVGNDNITLPRKRAHFQRVVRDEKVCRTVFGGNGK